MGDPTAGGPVDAAGIPLARRDYPVTLPKRRRPGRRPASPRSGGELQIYNYADYLNPEVIKEFGKQEGVSVRVTTFDTLDEAFTKLSHRPASQFDVIFTAPDQLSRLVGRRADPAAEPRPVPNLQKSVWPELHSPFYDVGPRYTVPYTLYTTGIGWRNDKLGDFDPTQARAAVGRVLDRGRAVPRPRRRSSTTRARGSGMALMRRGVTDLNTEDPDAARARRRGPARSSTTSVARQGHDQRLRDAAGRAHVAATRCGRATCSTRSSPTCPRARAATCSPTGTSSAGGPIFNDCICVGAERGQAGDGAPLPELHARPEGRATRTSSATSATSRRSPRSTPTRCSSSEIAAREPAQHASSRARTTRTATPT